jgi:hypothetical protein
MLNATRRLIFDRSKQTKRIVEAAIVSRFGDGRFDQDGLMPHTSYAIALREYNSNPMRIMVAGWLVLPFNKLDRTTHILHHWWNIDMQTKKQFDHTFKQSIGDDYVIDHDLTWNILRRFNRYLTEAVCSSLLLSDGGYQAIDLSDNGNVAYRNLCDLSFKQLCPNIAELDPLSEKAMSPRQSHMGIV